MAHAPEPFWNQLVETYFQWYRKRYNTSPAFKGSAPRDLRLIIAMLRQNSKWKEWKLDTAKLELTFFLGVAYGDLYLRDHWSLSELYKMKDEIYSSYTKTEA